MHELDNIRGEALKADSSGNAEPAAAYRLGPFSIRSEFPIPELPPAAAGVIADVWVHYGIVPPGIDGAVTRVKALEVSPREALLRIEGVAQFLIRDGLEVILQPEPGALESDLRSYLAAAAFGVLCHQRGMLPLHASSIEIGGDEIGAGGGGVAAFLGDSGAGKSTLAAFLARRGHTVVSDDICLLDFSSGNAPLVVPVAPWMKLWRSTIEQLGASSEKLPRIFSDDDKYRLEVGSTTERRPLKQIFLLEWLPEAGTTTTIERLDTLHAIQGLLEFTHQPYLIEGMGRERECFELCGRALSGVEAFRLQRPRGFEHMERVLDAVEVHLGATGR